MLLAGCVTTQSPKRARIATAEPSPSASPLAAPKPASHLTPAESSETTSGESVLPCADREGNVQTISVESKILGNALGYSVYLPPCYTMAAPKSYPVLYLFHGQGRAPDQWTELGLIQTANREIVSGALPPILIVMPHIVAESTGSAVVVADLLPAVDSGFRTIADREHRAIGGVSRGAEWALRVGLGRADLFSAIGLHSLAPSDTLWQDAPSLSRNVPEGMWPRIYIDIGVSDPMLASTERLTTLWDAEQHPYEKFLPPGDHSDGFWAQHISDYLAWYGQPWK
jgi:enterochelin esterase-like enzyme